MSIELAKVKLEKALERLEDVLESKIGALEFENKNLRAELSAFKNQPLAVRKRATTKEEKSSEIEQPNLLNTKAASDIDLTLSKLKKLVG